MAATGDKQYSAKEANYAHPDQMAHKLLARPAVQAEIVRQQQERLFNEILPLAVKTHKELLTSATTPAGAKVQAIKLAYEHTLGQEDAANHKEPHEMTGEEIAKSIAELERIAAGRAKDVTPSGPADGDVFA